MAYEGMFANNISSAFIIDLLFIVFLFLFWSYQEAKKYQIKAVGMDLGIYLCIGNCGRAAFILVREGAAKDSLSEFLNSFRSHSQYHNTSSSIDEYLASMQEIHQIPGLAVVIIQNGEVLYENYRGLASLSPVDSVDEVVS